MPLKIIKSHQPIHITTLVGVLYSPPGLGKSTMGFTAAKPLLLDCDKGAHRAKNRRDITPVETWADIADLKAEDFAGYSTVVIDTAGRALDILALAIIKEDPKYGKGGTLSLKGFGELKSRFTAWLKLVRSFGLDVVLIVHSEEKLSGDDVIERLDVQGGSKNEIYKSADFMGRISIVNGKRMLNLSPTDTAFGKNPGQLPPLEVPHYDKDPEFLAGVIAQTKDAINALTEEQTQVASLLSEWAERIEKLEPTAEAFNAMIGPAKAAEDRVRDNVKRLLVKVAKERGLAFDQAKGTFSEAPTQKAAAPAQAAAKEGAPANDATPSSDVPGTGKTDEGAPADGAASTAESDEEAANRKAAEPTQAEIEKMEKAERSKGSKKDKAA